MAKKRKFESNIRDVDKYIGKLKYKDLKRECVIRGMPFDDILNGDIPRLSVWLGKNFTNITNHGLLDVFDDYQEDLIRKSMEAKNQDPSELIHPSLRLGYIGERDEEGNVLKRKRVKTLIKKKRTKRERTEKGIFKGTKKALTYQLQSEGMTKDEVIKLVIEKFPGASEKSVGIWYNKSKKLSNGK